MGGSRTTPVLGHDRGVHMPIMGYSRMVPLLGHDRGVYGPNRQMKNAGRRESNRDSHNPRKERGMLPLLGGSDRGKLPWQGTKKKGQYA